MSIYPTVRPSLTLDFQKSKQLDPRITFSRSSSATYVEGGVVKTADENQARFEEEGLLLEESRTNLIAYSEEFNQWSNNAAVTVTTNNTAAPDGSNSADRVQPTTANNRHQVRQNVAVTYSFNNVFSLTIYAKAGLNDQIFLYLASANFGFARGVFDLTTLTATGLDGGIVSIEEFSGGWRKLTLIATATTGGTTIPIQIGKDDNFEVGDPTQDYYLWCAQLEDSSIGKFPTSYIPTAGSASTRASDVCEISGQNFSSWYNQSEGSTLVALTTKYPPTQSNGFIQFTDGTVSKRIEFQQAASGAQPLRVGGRIYDQAAGINLQFLNIEEGWVNNGIDIDKWCLAIDNDGATFATRYDNTPSTVTGPHPLGINNVVIGHRGHIARFTYYPERLTDTQLETLTL